MSRKSDRPTIRTIAKACGVSATAVSLALRNSEEISVTARERIQQTARKLGYRPDPVLTHLMEHLRFNSKTNVRASLALLSTSDAPFARRIVAGAEACATRLGYSLDRIPLKTYKNKPGALTRMLVARGVAGVLLAPASEPMDYRELLDWSKVTAVAMTYSIFEPQMNRVVTHHFENAVRTFALLSERGFKRIGFAMTTDMEFRANHSYSGAYYRMQPMMGGAILPILMLEANRGDLIREWFAKHRPDAVVLANANHLADEILPNIDRRTAEKTAFVCLDHEERYGMAGIDQLFEIIGEHSVETLVAQINRNERGLPLHPKVTMVQGEWRDSHGLYPFAAKAGTRA